MYRLWVNWRAKRKYVYKEEFDAGIAELSAKAALYRAEETRRAAAKVRKEADGLAARIAQMTEMEANGYWECENGHEKADAFLPEDAIAPRRCLDCKAPAKFLKRSSMSPKERYESDKERKDAEKVAEQKRGSAAELDKEVENQELTAKNFISQANRGRAFADLLSKL